MPLVVSPDLPGLVTFPKTVDHFKRAEWVDLVFIITEPNDSRGCHPALGWHRGEEIPQPVRVTTWNDHL